MFERRVLWRALAAGLGFFIAGTLAVMLTRFDGGFAFIWVASPVLLAYLVTSPRKEWPAGLIATSIASVVVSGVFGLGWAAAPSLLAANLLEATVAALMFPRSSRADPAAESLGVLFRFMFAAGVATIGSSIIAGLTLAGISDTPFMSAAINWYTGHTLGLLTFAPILVLLFSGEVKRRWAKATARKLGELALLMALVGLVTTVVFAQSKLPLLFLPILPIILTTFRAGRLGAALALIVLAVISAAFTISGRGPISLMVADVAMHARFLQFYLAATVIPVLPIAVDLAARRELVRALRESEARYRVLADHSTDIIMNLDVKGRIRFISPAAEQLLGRAPHDLLGAYATDLIGPAFVDVVRDAHIRAVRANGGEERIEYLAPTLLGESRWFESRMRAVVEPGGKVSGVVSVTRDIGDRKALETSLANAAMRDSLTGVLNRRGFMRELEAILDLPDGLEPGGCLALFDIDHFKAVNDTYGHAAGDRVLGHFARIAQRIVRGGDFVGRVGGEEFAVILRSSTLEQAEAICERLRQVVAGSPCYCDEGEVTITISGGVTKLRGTSAAILKAADKGLYAAKRGGRDRLAVAA